jgi:hypothetical protein
MAAEKCTSMRIAAAIKQTTMPAAPLSNNGRRPSRSTYRYVISIL